MFWVKRTNHPVVESMKRPLFKEGLTSSRFNTLLFKTLLLLLDDEIMLLNIIICEMAIVMFLRKLFNFYIAA